MKEIRNCITGSDQEYTFDIVQNSRTTPELIFLCTKNSTGRRLGIVQLVPVSSFHTIPIQAQAEAELGTLCTLRRRVRRMLIQIPTI